LNEGKNTHSSYPHTYPFAILGSKLVMRYFISHQH